MTRANTEQMKHTPWFAKAGAACSIVPIARFVSPNIFALKGGGYAKNEERYVSFTSTVGPNDERGVYEDWPVRIREAMCRRAYFAGEMPTCRANATVKLLAEL